RESRLPAREARGGDPRIRAPRGEGAGRAADAPQGGDEPLLRAHGRLRRRAVVGGVRRDRAPDDDRARRDEAHARPGLEAGPRGARRVLPKGVSASRFPFTSSPSVWEARPMRGLAIVLLAWLALGAAPAGAQCNLTGEWDVSTTLGSKRMNLRDQPV